MTFTRQIIRAKTPLTFLLTCSIDVFCVQRFRAARKLRANLAALNLVGVCWFELVS